MTAEEISALHAESMRGVGEAWSAQDFSALLTSPGVFLVSRPAGFALIRVAADEAELLALAVDPARRRRGVGRALLVEAIAAAAPRARTMFLEVSAINAPARQLYAGTGFEIVGRRPGYYLIDGARVDALICRRRISLDQL